MRDAANAHVRALETTKLGGQRLPIVAPELTDYGAAVRWIGEAYPHLRGTIVDPQIIPSDLDKPAYDRGWPAEGTKNALGMAEASYSSWRTTVLDTVQSLIALQKLGYDLPSGVECNSNVFNSGEE